MPNTNAKSLPAQMIPISRKGKEWREDVMDRLESIGTSQIIDNLRLKENYEIIKGKFIFEHYLEQQDYQSLLTDLNKDFELPKYLKHYDIIAQVVNVLSGEYQQRPDNFKVKGYDERTTNAYLREKTSLLTDYVVSQIKDEVRLKLISEGIDPDREDFQSEEEQQQYQQAVQERTKALTPPEIEKYMVYEWQDVAEVWGQYQLEKDRQRFNLPEKEKKEFEDMLTADRCFRHFYLKGEDDYDQETWNPLNTFFHKSPEVDYVEDGDYVGRVLYMSASQIIDRYGWLMKASEIERLQAPDDKYSKRNRGKGENPHGVPHGAVVPFENYQDHKVLADSLGYDPYGIQPIADDDYLLVGRRGVNLETQGLMQVTEAYWMSQRKIGKVNYIDPETGVMMSELVDETFVVPEHFKQIKSAVYESDEPDTVTWTWVNEVWKGIKINPKRSSKSESLYIDVKPQPFQFKSEYNPYGCKLPVCGQIFNNRNADSMSLVDLMKHYQIMYNLAMNQMYGIMEREVGMFFLLETRMIPKLKDWAGENAFQKFMDVAKSLGYAPIDSSRQNTQGEMSNSIANVVNLDESSRIMSRAKVAEFIEMQALKQVGFNPQRVGSVTATETATGTRQAMSQSYAATESHFTNFSNYKRRCLTMNLDISQYVQSRKENITLSYTKSDISRAFIKLNGEDLLLRDLSVYVSNSQEDARQLETLRQLALTNNTTTSSMVDIAAIITMNSPVEIKKQLEMTQKRVDEQQAQMQQIEQQKLDQQRELFQAQQDNDNLNKQLDRESKEKIAYIQTFGRQDDNMKDTDGSDGADMLEYDRFQHELEKDEEAARMNKSAYGLNERKLDFDREKEAARRTEAQQKLGLEREKMQNKLAIEKKNLEIVKAQKAKK